MYSFCQFCDRENIYMKQTIVHPTLENMSCLLTLNPLKNAEQVVMTSKYKHVLRVFNDVLIYFYQLSSHSSIISTFFNIKYHDQWRKIWIHSRGYECYLIVISVIISLYVSLQILSKYFTLPKHVLFKYRDLYFQNVKWNHALMCNGTLLIWFGRQFTIMRKQKRREIFYGLVKQSNFQFSGSFKVRKLFWAVFRYKIDVP